MSENRMKIEELLKRVEAGEYYFFAEEREIIAKALKSKLDTMSFREQLSKFTEGDREIRTVDETTLNSPAVEKETYVAESNEELPVTAKELLGWDDPNHNPMDDVREAKHRHESTYNLPDPDSLRERLVRVLHAKGIKNVYTEVVNLMHNMNEDQIEEFIKKNGG